MTAFGSCDSQSEIGLNGKGVIIPQLRAFLFQIYDVRDLSMTLY